MAKRKISNKELLSRREFFRKGTQTALPILVSIALPSIITSCTPDNEEWGCSECSSICSYTCYESCSSTSTSSSCDSCSSGCESSCSGSCSTTCEGSSQSSSCSGCSNSCSGDCAESCGNSCGNNCSSSCKDSSSGGGTENNDRVSSASGCIDGYEYVDLGLSVKWARYNIGASSPEKYGTHHIFASPSNSTTNLYDNLINAGYFGDDKSICGSQFDTATSQWGNKWQMPSKEHFKELIQLCKQEVVTYKNVKGILFTSNKNNKTIFFPFAGCYWRMDGWKKVGDESEGRYWTGFLSICRASTQDALYILMNQNGVEYTESFIMDIYERKYSIRPVTSDGNNSNPNNCQNSCTATCTSSCDRGFCTGGCSGGCSSSCSGTCSSSCSTSCTGLCDSSCYGTCKGGCDTTCVGSCAYFMS